MDLLQCKNLETSEQIEFNIALDNRSNKKKEKLTFTHFAVDPICKNEQTKWEKKAGQKKYPWQLINTENTSSTKWWVRNKKQSNIIKVKTKFKHKEKGFGTKALLEVILKNGCNSFSSVRLDYI